MTGYRKMQSGLEMSNMIFMAYGIFVALVAMLCELFLSDNNENFRKHVACAVLIGTYTRDALIAVGILTFLVSMIGYIAFSYDHGKTILLYTVCLLFSLTVLIGWAASAANATLSEKYVTEELKTLMANYTEGGSDPKSRAIDYLFIKYECCGIEHFSSEFRGKPFKNQAMRKASRIHHHSSIPISCCKGFVEKRFARPFFTFWKCLDHPNYDNAHILGCVHVMSDSIKLRKDVIVSIIVVVIIAQVLMLVGSFIFYFVAS